MPGLAGPTPAPAPALPQPAAQPQPLLGVIGDLTFTSQTVCLYPGDLLLSVTDGITERKDAVCRPLDDDDGLARVLARCGGLNAGAVAARIERAAEDFGACPPTTWRSSSSAPSDGPTPSQPTAPVPAVFSGNPGLQFQAGRNRVPDRTCLNRRDT